METVEFDALHYRFSFIWRDRPVINFIYDYRTRQFESIDNIGDTMYAYAYNKAGKLFNLP
jgi:hypothetical protein